MNREISQEQVNLIREKYAYKYYSIYDHLCELFEDNELLLAKDLTVIVWDGEESYYFISKQTYEEITGTVPCK